MKTLMITGLTGLLFAMTGTASAADYRGMMRDAAALKSSSDRALHDARFHLTGVRNRQHLMNDVAGLSRQAGHINTLVRRRGSLTHLQADLRTFRRDYDHVMDLVHSARPVFPARAFRPAAVLGNASVRNLDATLHQVGSALAGLESSVQRELYGNRPHVRGGERFLNRPAFTPTPRRSFRPAAVRTPTQRGNFPAPFRPRR